MRLPAVPLPVVWLMPSRARASLSSSTASGASIRGGYITAKSWSSIGGKWLEMLKDVAPAVSRVLVILQPRNIGQQSLLRAIEARLGSTQSRPSSTAHQPSKGRASPSEEATATEGRRKRTSTNMSKPRGWQMPSSIRFCVPPRAAACGHTHGAAALVEAIR